MSNVCGEVLAHHVCSSRSIRGGYTPSELVRIKVFERGLSAAFASCGPRFSSSHCGGNPHWPIAWDTHGAAYPVCEATATCAALNVDDLHEKEQVTNGLLALEGVPC